ncbi:hypothetical protein NEIELOOT_01816, partial [Neisseria elongata subsp. glycolytica ATCC 29315]
GTSFLGLSFPTFTRRILSKGRVIYNRKGRQIFIPAGSGIQDFEIGGLPE